MRLLDQFLVSKCSFELKLSELKENIAYREEHLSATGFHHGNRHVLLLRLRQHCWRWLNLQLRRLLHHGDVLSGRSHTLVVRLAEY